MRYQEVPSSKADLLESLGEGFFSMTKPHKKIKENISFFNRWAKTYDRKLFQFWMKKFHVPIFKELYLFKNTKFLDLSCGTGELLKNLEGKAELYGIDISEEMLKVAKHKLGSKAHLQKADVHLLPFEDDSFDYVVSTEAFHHYYDQQKALQEMSRIVKESGKVIIVDINFFLKPIHWLFQTFEPGCVKINNRKEIRLLFAKAGLKNIKQRRNFLFAVMTVGEK